MKCSDLNRKAFILDRKLLAKDDYLSLLAQPKRTYEMRRAVSCPCQPKPHIPPASYRIEKLAQPKRIYTENVCNMSIFRVETMMNQITRRDFMSPRDMLRALSEADNQQRNKECREKKLERDRLLKKMCQDSLEGLLNSMRTLMLEMDPLTRNSDYYRDIQADLFKLLKLKSDEKLQKLPKHILSKIALKTAHRVESIVEHANRQTQNEIPYDCLEDCKRGKFELERCLKQRFSEGEFFDAADDVTESVADDSDDNFTSIRDSCDDILRKSQLTMDGVDCKEIFDLIEGYNTHAAERKIQQEARAQAKAAKLAARAAKKAAAKKALGLPECVPGAGGPKKWEVAFGRQS